MSSFFCRIARSAFLSAGVVAVSLVALYPRVTEAEEVSEQERAGEYDEDGARFGDIVVKGELVAAAGAPGGWSLVRTAENTSDRPAEADVEEQILETQTMIASRVGGSPVAVLTRHQKIKLGAHEKKIVGTTFSRELGEKMTSSAKLSQAMTAAYANIGDGPLPDPRPYKEYRAEYLRELRAGETAMKRVPQVAPQDILLPPSPSRAELALGFDGL